MRIITGIKSNKARIALILTAFVLLASALTLATVVCRKISATESVKGEDYIYQAFDSTKDTVPTEAGRGVLVLGKDYDSNRTDAIICVYFNYKSGTVSTLQIPRDTYVTDGDFKGRINALLPKYRTVAVSAGAEDPLETGIYSLMDKISADFGVKLDNYVFLDSSAVEAITNAFGGVTIDIPADIHYTDLERGLDLHLNKGVQRLNGKQAAQFIRYRQGYPQADIGRINAQKLYAAAMISRLKSFSSVTAAVSLVNTMGSFVKTDIDAETMALLTTKLCLAKKDDVVMYNLPGDGVRVSGASYYGTNAKMLAEVLKNGFVPVSATALKVCDFSTVAGGYSDTDGVTLSQALQSGIDIPVFAD